MTLRPGSRFLASSAVHRPQNPPPTTARSARPDAPSAGRVARRADRPSQYGTGAAASQDLTISYGGSIPAFSPHLPIRGSPGNSCGFRKSANLMLWRRLSQKVNGLLLRGFYLRQT
jgi:hypothetical protein